MLVIGDEVELVRPLRPGIAKLVSIIGAGSIPNPEQVKLWYGETAPTSVYRASRRNRFIFQRNDTGGYVIVPETILEKVTQPTIN